MQINFILKPAFVSLAQLARSMKGQFNALMADGINLVSTAKNRQILGLEYNWECKNDRLTFMDISGNLKPSCIQTSSFFCCRPDQLHYNRAADYREKLEVANWGTGLPALHHVEVHYNKCNLKSTLCATSFNFKTEFLFNISLGNPLPLAASSLLHIGFE